MTPKKYEGILEIMPQGYGVLRDPLKNFALQNDDPRVSAEIIRRLGLREGLLISALAQSRKNGHAAPEITKIVQCNGRPVEVYRDIPELKEGTSIDPEERLRMTLNENDILGAAIDLITPIGKGQRGMIISPPKAGKTTILKHIAHAVHQNHPEVAILVLLIDERPEEVTDFKRDLRDAARVYHSSADQDVESHLRMTMLTMYTAMRRMEFGEDVLVLIDSLTRMGRAFNRDTDSHGRTLSGGLAAGALELPRRFFGAARNLEGGGSLTTLATILVDTGSRMDEVIFQEFKGTGNLDLVLSRECAERRLFPAINIRESGTRKEHKLLDEEEMRQSARVRRAVAGMNPPEALEYFLDYLRGAERAGR